MTTPRLLAALLAAVIAMTAGGCEDPNRVEIKRLSGELDQSKQATRQLQHENQMLREDLVAQQKQFQLLNKLGDRRLEKLFQVARIGLGRHTGGIDLNAIDGDDGIRVYLRPIDQHGSIIKAAGEVTIRLFDLSADPNQNLVGQRTISAEDTSKYWAGGLMNYQFTFDCPWQAQPTNDEITVQVRFADYLTGKIFTAQKLCRVKLPPEVIAK